jgi:hypothetical protein
MLRRTNGTKEIIANAPYARPRSGRFGQAALGAEPMQFPAYVCLIMTTPDLLAADFIQDLAYLAESGNRK